MNRYKYDNNSLKRRETPTVFSFDIYDTCISRNFARPRDLFLAIGERLAGVGLTSPTKNAFIEEIWRCRVNATRYAHQVARPCESVTLKEIYQHFVISSDWEFTVNDLYQLELEIERANVFPIKDIAQRIKLLRNKNIPILFISDMYLPANFIGSMLKDFSLMQENDSLYVSCEIGLTKKSGRLFSHVLAAENLKPAQLYHLGDDPINDVIRPKKLGIIAEQFTLSALTRHESNFLNTFRTPTMTASKITAISRRIRLSQLSNESHLDNTLKELTCAVIAPFLTLYVAWVLRDANQRGISRLYFVARDGEIMFKIAKVLSLYQPTPELRYLYGSRRAWLTSAIDFENSEWKRLVVVSGQGNNLSDILGRLGITPTEIAESLVKLGFSLKQPNNHVTTEKKALLILNQLISDAKIRDILQSKTASSREKALGYLSQEGLLDNENWALVDVGWRLICQTLLKQILDYQKFSGRVRGYYVGLSKDHLPSEVAGNAYSFLPKNGHLFVRRQIMFEQLFTAATHPSTLRYAKKNGNYIPIFNPEERTIQQINDINERHALICEYTDIIAKEKILNEDNKEFSWNIIAQAEHLFSNPSHVDATALSNLYTQADMRHKKTLKYPLCRALTQSDMKEILKRSIFKSSAFQELVTPWLEGSAVLSPLFIRIPLQAMLIFQRLLKKE